MKRYRDWPRRLQEMVEARARTPFAYGSHDCCLFAADCVIAMTGVDPAKPFRGYKTVRGARFRRQRHGGVAGLLDKAMAALGCREVPSLKAQRGDMVLVITERGEAAGIVDTTGRGVLIADLVGVGVVPLTLAARAWRISA